MLIIAPGTGGWLTRGRSGCERRWRLSCVFIYFNITPQQGNKSSLKHSISFYLCTLLILCKGFIILCTLLTLSYSIILFEKKFLSSFQIVSIFYLYFWVVVSYFITHIFGKMCIIWVYINDISQFLNSYLLIVKLLPTVLHFKIEGNSHYILLLWPQPTLRSLMKILFIIHLNILWLILNLERDFTNFGELLQNLACQLFLFYFILWVGFAFRFLTTLYIALKFAYDFTWF